MTMNIQLSETKTNYQRQRLGVAVVTVNGRRVELGLGDTTRCARSQEAATRLLANLAGDDGDADEINGAAAKLHAHCRKVVGLKDVLT
jgi:hypothetical protein